MTTIFESPSFMAGIKPKNGVSMDSRKDKAIESANSIPRKAVCLAVWFRKREIPYLYNSVFVFSVKGCSRFVKYQYFAQNYVNESGVRFRLRYLQREWKSCILYKYICKCISITMLLEFKTVQYVLYLAAFVCL